MGKMNISSPIPIDENNDCSNFDCGEGSLNYWLKNRALKKQKSCASSVFVIEENNQIIGFYCLAAGAISHAEVPKKLSRNTPAPLPIILLGRLAVDNRYKGQGIGADLLRDAIIRIIAIANNVGVVAIVTHALNDNAKSFYMQYGFIESNIAEMTLILPLKNIISQYSD